MERICRSWTLHAELSFLLQNYELVDCWLLCETNTNVFSCVEFLASSTQKNPKNSGLCLLCCPCNTADPLCWCQFVLEPNLFNPQFAWKQTPRRRTLSYTFELKYQRNYIVQKVTHYPSDRGIKSPFWNQVKNPSHYTNFLWKHSALILSKFPRTTDQRFTN